MTKMNYEIRPAGHDHNVRCVRFTHDNGTEAWYENLVHLDNLDALEEAIKEIRKTEADKKRVVVGYVVRAYGDWIGRFDTREAAKAHKAEYLQRNEWVSANDVVVHRAVKKAK